MQMSVYLVFVSMAMIMPAEGRYTMEQLVRILDQLGEPTATLPVDPTPQEPVDPAPQEPAEPVPQVPAEPETPAITEPAAISAITNFATMGKEILTKLQAELGTLTTQAMTQMSLKPALDILEDIVPDVESYFDELKENAMKLAEELPPTATSATSSNTPVVARSLIAPSESLATSILTSFSTTGAETLTNLQAELGKLKTQAATQTELAGAVEVLEDTVPEIEEFLSELTESINMLKAALPSTVSTANSATGVTMDQSAATELLNKLTELGQDFADKIQMEQTRLTSEATTAQNEADSLFELADQEADELQKNLYKTQAEAMETKADQLRTAVDVVADILSDFDDLKENLLEWIQNYTAALPPPASATASITDVQKRTLSSFLQRLLALPRSVQ